MLKEIEKFNSTKYGILYIKIIQKANKESRKKLKKDDPFYVYYELHHILPKSIYPEYKNLKKFPSNSILLTAREHFICHILLMKHYRKLNNKKLECSMSKALVYMSNSGNNSSKIYEKLKLNMEMSEETKNKLRGRIVKESSIKKQLENTNRKKAEEKRQLTNLKKYGGVSPTASDKVVNKRKNTLSVVKENGLTGFQENGKKISEKLKNRIPCKDIFTGEKILVDKSIYDKTWYYVGRTGKNIQLFEYNEKLYTKCGLKNLCDIDTNNYKKMRKNKPYKNKLIPIEDIVKQKNYYFSIIDITS